MSLEKYIRSLGGESPESQGGFTLDPNRAERLLREKALPDIWLAWRCLLQGLYDSAPQSLNVQVQRKRVLIKANFSSPVTLGDLMGNERFLLGWLNLDWFGEARWSAEASELTVLLKGSVLRRYRTSGTLSSLLTNCLRYAICPTTVNGSSPISGAYPVKPKYTFFLASDQATNSLGFPRPMGEMKPDQFRMVITNENKEGRAAGEAFAAIAFKSRQSWSQARWVSHGVVIKEERNTLERPGLTMVASVQSLGLNTDLSGFSVIHDDAYSRFINLLKKEVLWML